MLNMNDSYGWEIVQLGTVLTIKKIKILQCLCLGLAKITWF